MNKTKEQAGHKTEWRLEKREGDIDACKTPEERKAFLKTEPLEVIKGEGNVLLYTGVEAIWLYVVGDTPIANAFNHTNARLGVGNSSTTASPTQTDLLGASKFYKIGEDMFPNIAFETSPPPYLLEMKSSFGPDDANFTWNEWVIKNNATGKCLNRKVASLGPKSGGTWTLFVTIQIT